MSEISIRSPINQQDFWLTGVFYTGNELRLGALSERESQLSSSHRKSVEGAEGLSCQTSASKP